MNSEFLTLGKRRSVVLAFALGNAPAHLKPTARPAERGRVRFGGTPDCGLSASTGGAPLRIPNVEQGRCPRVDLGGLLDGVEIALSEDDCPVP